MDGTAASSTNAEGSSKEKRPAKWQEEFQRRFQEGQRQHWSKNGSRSKNARNRTQSGRTKTAQSQNWKRDLESLKDSIQLEVEKGTGEEESLLKSEVDPLSGFPTGVADQAGDGAAKHAESEPQSITR